MSKTRLQLLSYASGLLILCLSLAFASTLPHELAAAVAEPLRSAPGYVGSERCQACHSTAYQSWQKTYHSSMTRTVRDLSFDGIKSPQLPAEFLFHGRALELFRSADGRVYYRGPDLHDYGQKLARLKFKLKTSKSKSPVENSYEKKQALLLLNQVNTVEREVVLTTGSHHYIAFFVGGPGKELRQFPFVYYLEDKAWLQRQDAFIQPPEAAPHIARWNANCIQCHSVAGAPRQTEHLNQAGQLESHYNTEVAELGIACEACHGPGSQHSSTYESPFTRLKQELSGQAAVDIQNPRSLSQENSSQICGQCHSYFLPADEESFWSEGHRFGYLPGKKLGQTRDILALNQEKNTSQRIEAERRQIFYDNGAMRVAGREYNDLLASPCFNMVSKDKDQLGCLSCHKSHDSDPNDQLNPRLSEAQLCTQCHQREQLNQQPNRVHELHGLSAGPTSAQCIDCHMPKTSYALLKSIRSHRIIDELQLPPAKALTKDQRPSKAPPSCVLCHITEGRSFFELKDAEFEEPYSLTFILSGDAGVRAVMAEAFSTNQHSSFAQSVLEFLQKNETYSAVQWIVKRGLKKIALRKKESDKSDRAFNQNNLLEKMNQAWLRRDRRPLAISE